MKISKILLIGALVVAGSWAAYVGLQPAPESASGFQAPGFSIPAVGQAGKVSLADHQGEVVLVNFWATWCPPCRHEVPDFVTVQKELGPKGFRIVGVSLDDGPGVVEQFMGEYGINYPVGMGNQEVASLYGGITAIPASFLIDRQGQVVQRFSGAIDAETLRQAVTPLL